MMSEASAPPVVAGWICVLLNALYRLNSEISDEPSSPDEIAVSHMLSVPECHVMMGSPSKIKVGKR
jgi:hypothetical protein